VQQQRKQQKTGPEREFDRGGPPEEGGGDPPPPRTPNAETDPETRAAAGGTPLPEAAVERASKRAKGNEAALREVFSQFLDDDTPNAQAKPTPAAPATPATPATKKKK
jgi:hypothetical protein